MKHHPLFVTWSRHAFCLFFFSTCRRSLSTSKRKASTKNQTLRCTRTITYFYGLSHNLFFGHHNLMCYKNRLLPLISKRIKKKKKEILCKFNLFMDGNWFIYYICLFFFIKCAKHKANFESERAPAKRFHIIIYNEYMLYWNKMLFNFALLFISIIIHINRKSPRGAWLRKNLNINFVYYHFFFAGRRRCFHQRRLNSSDLGSRRNDGRSDDHVVD